MTLPTKLTLSRIVLTFITMALLFTPGLLAKSAALICFVLASATDWLDGWLARRWRQVSPLGVLLDPIADKILILGVFLACVQLGLIPAWMVLIIALRELLITSVRLMAARRQLVLPAAAEGKHKTVSQVLTILVVLVSLIAQERSPAAFWRQLIELCMWVTLVLTVVSGTTFFTRHWSVLNEALNHERKHHA